MAPILLRQPESLELVLMKHPHVIATLVGHAHTACATTFAGRPLLIGGGCASTVPLDSEPYPVIWEAGPPTLAFHLLHDDPPHHALARRCRPPRAAAARRLNWSAP